MAQRFKRISTLAFTGLLGFGQSAFAAGGAGPINYYEILLSSLGVHNHGMTAIPSALLVLVLLTVIGFIFKSALERAGDRIEPEESFTLRTFVEMILDFVYALGEDILGKKDIKRFFPLLASLFLFIFICNLSGLVPGFPPATENLSVNLSIGLVVFLLYNVAGFKEHGFSYVKQFLGPVLLMAPIILPIEVVSHLVRPLSLGLRLTGNIFGDHLVLSVFTSLTYVVVPALLLFFGLLVASIQSFVFTLLSSIYISLAVSHDH